PALPRWARPARSPPALAPSPGQPARRAAPGAPPRAPARSRGRSVAHRQLSRRRLVGVCVYARVLDGRQLGGADVQLVDELLAVGGQADLFGHARPELGFLLDDVVAALPARGLLADAAVDGGDHAAHAGRKAAPRRAVVEHDLAALLVDR